MIEAFRAKGLFWFNGKYLSDGKRFLKRTITQQEFEKFKARKKPLAKTSARFMYKSLARYWFEVTGVKAKRVQDISNDDINAEGITLSNEEKMSDDYRARWLRSYFEALWDSINAKRYPKDDEGKDPAEKRFYSWKNNPWVFATSYKRIDHGKVI